MQSHSRKLIAGLTTLCIAVGGWHTSMLNEKNNVLNKQEQTIEEQKQAIKGYNIEIFSLNRQLAQQQAKVDSLKGTVDSLSEKNAKLKGKNDTYSDKISNLKEKNDNLEEKVDIYKDRSQSPSVSSRSTSSASHHSKEVETVAKTNDSRTLRMEATSYIALCSTGCSGVTATGIDVRNKMRHKGYRVVAVDPDVVPLYSLVRVDTGNNRFKALALDVGGDIKGHRIDILTNSRQKAINFGRQSVEVTILRHGK